MEKFCRTIFGFWAVAFMLITSQARSQTPGGANGMVFRFTKQVWLNPTIILAKQNFEQATNVKLLILPRVNGDDTTGSSRIEKAFDKLLSFLVFKENVQGSIKFYFNPKNTTKPFTFNTSDELHCKFTPIQKDSVETILNKDIVNSSNLNTFTALPFDSIISRASRYCKRILQSKPGPCGENPGNEFTLTKINSTPAKLNFEKGMSPNPTAPNGGVDAKKYPELEQYYNTVLDVADNSNYPLSWKAMAANTSDVVKLKLKKKQSYFDISKLVFKNANGTETYNVTYSNINRDSVIDLSISGKSPGSMTEVVAYYTPTTTPTQTFAIGAFNVQFYEPKTLNVVLATLDSPALPSVEQSKIQDSLNKIYGSVFVKWNVSSVRCDVPPYINKNLHAENSGLLSNYMSDMQPLVSNFKNTCSSYNGNSQTTFYILIGSTIDDSNLKGYMPRGRNTGFIFLPANNPQFVKTLGHELGHGAFNLKHIFCSEELGEGYRTHTNNLMDYNNGNTLYKHQWDLIHTPDVVGWFEGDDDEGAYNTSNIAELKDFKNNGYYAFVNPKGDIIRLPEDIKSVAFVTDAYVDISSHLGQFIVSPVGSLQGFTDKNNIKFNYAISNNGYKSTEGSNYTSFVNSLSTEKVIFGFPCMSSGEIKFKVFAGGINPTQLIDYKNYNTATELPNNGSISPTQLIDLTNQFNGVLGVLRNLENKIITANLSSGYSELSLNYVLSNQPQCNCDNSSMLQPYIFGINSFIQNNPQAQAACNNNTTTGYRGYIASVLDRELISKGIPGVWSQLISENPSLANTMVVPKGEEYYKKSLFLWPKLYARLGNISTLSYNADRELIEFISEESSIWCIFKTLPFTTRVSLINELLADHSEKNEELILGLLSEIVNEDKDALIDKFQTSNSFFYQLYHYFEDSYNREAFVSLVLSYNKNINSTPTIMSSLTSVPIGTPPLTFDLLYIGKNNLYTTWNNNGLTISNSTYQMAGGGLNTFVKLVLTEDIDFLGLKKDDELTVPLFYAYHLKKLIIEEERAFFVRNTFRLISIVAAVPTGGATLVFAVALNGADLVIDINSNAIAQMQDGEELLNSWHAFYVVADLTNTLRFKMNVPGNINRPGFADRLRNFINASKGFLNKSGMQVLEFQNFLKAAFAEKTFTEGLTFIKNGFVKEVRNNLVAVLISGNVRYSIATMDYLEGIGEFCYHFSPGKTIVANVTTLAGYERIGKVEKSYYFDEAGQLVKGDFEIYRHLVTLETVILKVTGTESSFAKLTTKSSLSTPLFNAVDNMLTSAPSIKFKCTSGILDNPKLFLNATGPKMYDLILPSGTYAKVDMGSGRMLFVHNNYYAYVEYPGIKNTITNITEIEQLVMDKVTKMKNILGYNGVVTVDLLQEVGGPIQASAYKVTTFIGKTTETQLLKNQFGDFKHVLVGETPGSVNLLNMPDPYFNGATWWVDQNRDWIMRAINRGDDIYIASPLKNIDMNADNILFSQKYGPSYYANELKALVDANYKPINLTISEWQQVQTMINTIFN